MSPTAPAPAATGRADAWFSRIVRKRCGAGAFACPGEVKSFSSQSRRLPGDIRISVFTASDPEEGLEILVRAHPRIVVADLVKRAVARLREAAQEAAQ